MRIHVIAAAIVLGIASVAQAIPLKKIKLQEVSGKVLAYAWVGATKSEEAGAWGHGGFSLNYRASNPARYYLVIKAPKVDQETRDAVSAYVREERLAPKLLSRALEGDEMLLLVSSKRLKEMKPGVAVTISEYQIGGDETGPWSSKKTVLIDGKVGTEVEDN